MNIYVGNLSRDVSDNELRELFEEFGQVESVHVMKDRFTGEPRGFGFVEMPSKEEGNAAIENLNGKALMGNKIKVSEANPRPDRPQRKPGGGGGGGSFRGKSGFGGGGGGGGPRNNFRGGRR